MPNSPASHPQWTSLMPASRLRRHSRHPRLAASTHLSHAGKPMSIARVIQLESLMAVLSNSNNSSNWTTSCLLSKISNLLKWCWRISIRKVQAWSRSLIWWARCINIIIISRSAKGSSTIRYNWASSDCCLMGQSRWRISTQGWSSNHRANNSNSSNSSRSDTCHSSQTASNRSFGRLKKLTLQVSSNSRAQASCASHRSSLRAAAWTTTLWDRWAHHRTLAALINSSSHRCLRNTYQVVHWILLAITGYWTRLASTLSLWPWACHKQVVSWMHSKYQTLM